MRLLPLLALLLAPAALAQTPDTTSAWRYLPLAVGNAWEYETWVEDCPLFPYCETERVGYTRWTVAGEATVDGSAYVRIRSAGYSLSGALTYDSEELVRFDTLAARALVRVGDAEEPWPRDIPACRLDAPFDSVCLDSDGEKGYVYEGGIAFPSGLVGDKRIQGLIVGVVLKRDIGPLYYGGGEFGGSWLENTWARVDGVEYGQAVVSTTDTVGGTALAVEVRPNPSRGEATVALTMPSATEARAELFDILGRRVAVLHDGVLAAGTTRLALPPLTPGAYVVHIASTGGLASTSLRVVR